MSGVDQLISHGRTPGVAFQRHAGSAAGVPPNLARQNASSMEDDGMKDSLVPQRTSLQYDVEMLIHEFGDSFSRDTISKAFGQATEELKDTRFKKYVSLFAYRFARERLATMRAARLDGNPAGADASALPASAAQSGGRSGR
jgi:hypothetical protein